jgi:hypothetical protein
MRISKARFAVAAVLFALFFAGIGAGTALAYQSHMVNARSYLNDALSQLEAATPDKGGHRVNAINLVKSAITQVDLGIQAAQ